MKRALTNLARAAPGMTVEFSRLAAPAPRGFRRHLWLVWVLALASAAPAAIIGVAAASIFGVDLFLGDVLVVLTVAAASLVALVVAAVMAFKRRWRRVIGAAMIPVSLALTLLYAGELEAAGMTAGEYVRFRLERATYLAEIAALPVTTESRLAVFPLSSDGWVTHTHYHLVVYDESDEVAMPDARRSPAWQARIRDTTLESGTTYHVAAQGDHLYIVRVSD